MLKNIVYFLMTSLIFIFTNTAIIVSATNISPLQYGHTKMLGGAIKDRRLITIDVKVPTIFAFAVQVDPTKPTELPTVLSPNVGVVDVGGNKGLAVIGPSNLIFENNSSMISSGSTNPVGIEVQLSGVLTERSASTFKYNENILTSSNLGLETPKTYGVNINVDGRVSSFDNQISTNKYGMNNPIDLKAPTLPFPSRARANLEVLVGGTNAGYPTEQVSENVSTITWKVSMKP